MQSVTNRLTDCIWISISSDPIRIVLHVAHATKALKDSQVDDPIGGSRAAPNDVVDWSQLPLLTCGCIAILRTTTSYHPLLAMTYDLPAAPACVSVSPNGSWSDRLKALAHRVLSIEGALAILNLSSFDPIQSLTNADTVFKIRFIALYLFST